MATGFQINVDSCAFREVTSFFKCQHLGMVDSFIAVKALAHNHAILHNYGADQRVRLYLAFTFGGKCKREIEKVQVILSAGGNFPPRERVGDHSHSNSTSLRSIETISISRIGRRSDPRGYARLLVG